MPVRAGQKLSAVHLREVSFKRVYAQETLNSSTASGDARVNIYAPFTLTLPIYETRAVIQARGANTFG